MIHRDGLKIILTAFILAFALLMGGFVFDMNLLTLLFWLVFLFFLFSLWFFRNPDRNTPEGERLIVSPADGKVVEIVDTEDDYVGTARKVSIFMSVFNVHVNRIPMGGTVRSIDHQAGRFRAAMQPEASFENERTTITLENAQMRLKFAQVAGLIARRIVCRLEPGQVVMTGAPFGMIKFGSRVDLWMPRSVELRVAVGDRVTAGETVVGEVTCD